MKNNIVLIGMPGCGKTTIGKLLAEKLSYDFCDLDEYIVKKEKKSIDDMFKVSEEYFRDIESLGVKDMCDRENTVISTGGGVVKRHQNIETLKKCGIIIFIDRPVEHIVSDIDEDTRPLLKNDKDKIYELFDERYDLYKDSCNAEVINDKELERIVDEIVRVIK